MSCNVTIGCAAQSLTIGNHTASDHANSHAILQQEGVVVPELTALQEKAKGFMEMTFGMDENVVQSRYELVSKEKDELVNDGLKMLATYHYDVGIFNDIRPELLKAGLSEVDASRVVSEIAQGQYLANHTP